MHKLLLSATAILMLQSLGHAGPSCEFTSTGSETSLESGVLFGLSNKNDYVIAPISAGLTIAKNSPRAIGSLELAREWRVYGFGLVLIQGPENLMLGAMLGRRYELGNPESPFALVLDLRAGAGVIDSTDVEDAQGQDFAFPLAGLLGVEWRIAEDWSLTTGAIYTHISNGGLSEPERPNIGLDSVGTIIGVSHAF
jgi:hypothetical protein